MLPLLLHPSPPPPPPCSRCSSSTRRRSIRSIRNSAFKQGFPPLLLLSPLVLSAPSHVTRCPFRHLHPAPRLRSVTSHHTHFNSDFRLERYTHTYVHTSYHIHLVFSMLKKSLPPLPPHRLLLSCSAWWHHPRYRLYLAGRAEILLIRAHVERKRESSTLHNLVSSQIGSFLLLLRLSAPSVRAVPTPMSTCVCFRVDFLFLFFHYYEHTAEFCFTCAELSLRATNL